MGRVPVTSEQRLVPRERGQGTCDSLNMSLVFHQADGACQVGCLLLTGCHSMTVPHPRLVAHACTRQLGFFLQEAILIPQLTHFVK